MGTQLPSPKGAQHPTNFGPISISKGRMYQNTTWYGGTRHCVRWDPPPLPWRGTTPNFRPMSVVAKWLDGLRCHLVWS